MYRFRDVSQLNPNVAYPRRGKTRQSAPNVGARRLGQDEQYLAVREILSEASTLADGALSRERSDFYRFGHATLGFSNRIVLGPFIYYLCGKSTCHLPTFT